MSTITLVVIPGPGARTVTLTQGATISDLACQENLHGRDIIVNGQGVLPQDWQTTQIVDGSEVFATGSVKGNADVATLVVIPGPGARTVTLDQNMTVATLACRENLHGRDIIINGQGVLPQNWETTVLPPNSEIFATGSVKGNFF